MTEYFASTQEMDTFLRERKPLRAGGSGSTFKRVNSDSRTLTAGDLFVALKGDLFDGHQFVTAAKAAGATGAVVSREWADKQDRAALSVGFALWMVDDTLLALGDIARGHLRRLPMSRGALTGSNGKTTTKEFTAAILKAHFGDEKVLYTQGNLNNQIGVPQTAFRADGTQKIALFEMGMNHSGEIAAMCRIVEPMWALVTNVGPAHIGNFDGKIELIAAAKGEIFHNVSQGGTLVVNLDDPLVVAQAAPVHAQRVTYGRAATADVRLTEEVPEGSGQRVTLDVQGKHLTFSLKVPGTHNALNACAAAALAVQMGASLDSVVTGLNAAQTAAGRLTQKHATNGALVIDDSYNANPASMKASIDVARCLAEAGKHRLILILGDMLELGTREIDLHREVGVAAAASKPALLVLAGKRSKAAADAAVAAGLPVASVMHSDDLQTLLSAVEQSVQPNDVVLVKGSRGAKMERAVAALCGTTVTAGH